MNHPHFPKALDVSGLPSYKFSHHSLMWWGVMGMVLLEGTAFALAITTYFYLWSQAPTWPLKTSPPELFWGTLNLGVMLASAWPNHWTKKVGEADRDEGKMLLGMTVCALFGLALLVIRGFEFTALNVRWDTDAYGSAVWLLLGLHTVHLATDVYDTLVLIGVFLFARPLEGRRHVDVSENGLYWYFVVVAWIPIYVVIYLFPRMTS